MIDALARVVVVVVVVLMLQSGWSGESHGYPAWVEEIVVLVEVAEKVSGGA